MSWLQPVAKHRHTIRIALRVLASANASTLEKRVRMAQYVNPSARAAALEALRDIFHEEFEKEST